MTDRDLISVRRREVIEEIKRLTARTKEMEQELAELETAGRVMARLSGAKWPPSGSEDESKSKETTGGKPEGLPTMPEMIRSVLEGADQIGLKGLAPKDIAREISQEWWPDVPGENVSAIVWRMWKRGELTKRGSLYSVPQNNEAEDVDREIGSPSASNVEPQAKGREAVPGGGT